MKLARAARRFDTTLAADSYNPATTFHCQLAPLSLYKIDGPSVKRREMSCDPAIVIPARGCINIDGQNYVVGAGTPDQWNGVPIRDSYVLQGADHTANLNTIAAELTGTAPIVAYASLDFSRNIIDERVSSNYLSQYAIFFGGSESVPEDSLVNIGTRWFLVRQSYVSSSGLLTTLANEIEGPVFETVNFSTRTYNPVTDAYTAVVTAVKVLRVRHAEHFQYLTQGTVKYEHGDITMMMLKTAITPKAADTLALSDGTWKIISVQSEGLNWNCHARRA